MSEQEADPAAPAEIAEPAALAATSDPAEGPEPAAVPVPPEPTPAPAEPAPDSPAPPIPGASETDPASGGFLVAESGIPQVGDEIDGGRRIHAVRRVAGVYSVIAEGDAEWSTI